MVTIHVSAPVRPTEDPKRVEAAVTTFFPGATVSHDPGAVRAVTDDVGTLRRRIWELRIIDTFRSKAMRRLKADDDFLSVTISKQAAYAGKISFPPTPHPLGDLTVEVYVEPGDPWPDAEAFAWWLCPETRDGEIVGPTE